MSILISTFFLLLESVVFKYLLNSGVASSAAAELSRTVATKRALKVFIVKLPVENWFGTLSWQVYISDLLEELIASHLFLYTLLGHIFLIYLWWHQEIVPSEKFTRLQIRAKLQSSTCGLIRLEETHVTIFWSKWSPCAALRLCCGTLGLFSFFFFILCHILFSQKGLSWGYEILHRLSSHT